MSIYDEKIGGVFIPPKHSFLLKNIRGTQIWQVTTLSGIVLI
jgi:hypothetical protein